MARTFLLFCFLAHYSGAFLFDGSTPKPVTVNVNKNYDALLQLFMNERSARMELQNVVSAQTQELQQHRTAMTELNTRLERLEHQTTTVGTPVVCNVCMELEQKYRSLTTEFNSLRKNYSSLQLETIATKTELGATKNYTEELKYELTDLRSDLETEKLKTNQLQKEILNFKPLQAVDERQAIVDLKNFTKILQQDVKALESTNQARAQDLLALNRIITQNVQNISTLRQEVYSNDRSNRLAFVDLYQNLTSQIDTDLEILNSTVVQVLSDLIDMRTPVGFTAFGSGSADLNYGDIIHFPRIASSSGVSNLTSFVSNGQFKAEKSGFYFITTTILIQATSSTSYYYIYKNNIQIVNDLMYFGGRFYGSDHLETLGTGSIVLHLSAGDLVDVRTGDKMHVYTGLSSLTIVKIA